MRKRVLLWVPMLDASGEELLRKEVEVVDGSRLEPGARDAALAAAHGLYLPGLVTAELLERAPALEVIGFPGSGFESIDTRAATERPRWNTGRALASAWWRTSRTLRPR